MTDILTGNQFTIIGVQVTLNCEDDYLLQTLTSLYSMFETHDENLSGLEYHIQPRDDGSYSLTRRDPAYSYIADDIGMLVFLLEKDVTIEIQKRRQQYLFLHSAALAYKGRAILILAASGTGKSTLSWALAQSGFTYLSDELAPVLPRIGLVQAYPHALCLKQAPPDSFPLPESVIKTTRTMHIPTDSIPSVAKPDEHFPVRYVFFLARDPEQQESSVVRLTDSEAAMRLYVNALNQLAHDNAGLSAVANLAQVFECYGLYTGSLSSSVALLRGMMD
ncbi:MAG: hypothetical protein OEY29_15710 [Gammaproteobacteria bacterium]|nr:hypothetical protein [Gammaproteobacteria bacterium]